MAVHGTSRRGFIALLLTVAQGFLLAGPREVRAARREAKDLVRQLEREGWATAKPRRAPGVAWQTEGGETTLSRPGETAPLCRMNRTGRLVWDLCDGRHRPADMGRRLARLAGIDDSRAERDALAFLAELKRIGAIET